jgi:hypothetical protein
VVCIVMLNLQGKEQMKLMSGYFAASDCAVFEDIVIQRS